MEDKIYGIIESLLFVSGDPMPLKQIASILEMEEKDVHTYMIEIAEKYEVKERGIKLIRIEDKYQLVTKQEYSEYVEKIARSNARQSVSGAALEVLAIIAYKQPITRVEIDEIRGVKSDSVLSKLLERDLIKISGKLQTIGRPSLYKTSEEFLRLFNLESLKDLKNLDEFLQNEETDITLEKENYMEEYAQEYPAEYPVDYKSDL